MPEFIIHVGPHKTGTTYLQLSLKASRPTLIKRGIFYPEFWDLAPGNPSHLLLVNQLREGQHDMLAQRFAEIAASGVRKVLISAEDLSILDVPVLQTLRALIGDNPVKIVFYLRRWSELVPSSWQEGIKQGQSYTLPDFIILTLQRPDASRLLNFDFKLSRLVEAFGLENLTLVEYSELRDRNMDIFQHFCANFLEWPAAQPLARLDAANASREMREIEILRGLNSMARHRGAPASDRMRRAFDQSRATFDREALINGMEPFITTLRFNDDWPVLRMLHDQFHAKYEPSIIRPKRPGEIFRPKNVELRYVSPDYLLHPGMANMMIGLMDQLSKPGQS